MVPWEQKPYLIHTRPTQKTIYISLALLVKLKPYNSLYIKHKNIYKNNR